MELVVVSRKIFQSLVHNPERDHFTHSMSRLHKEAAETWVDNFDTNLKYHWFRFYLVNTGVLVVEDDRLIGRTYHKPKRKKVKRKLSIWQMC